MTAVLTIIATVAGVLLDLILDAISWACYCWERRL